MIIRRRDYLNFVRSFVLGVVLFGVGFLCVSLYASEVVSAQSKQVKSVDVQGQRRLTKESILKSVVSRPGVLDSDTVSQDIKQIFDLGYFEDVKALYDADRKALIYEVLEKPTIVEVSFSGNEEKESDDLKEEVSTKPFTFLDYATLKTDVRSLEEFYAGEGYFLAQPSYKVEELKPGEVRVTYEISEGREVLIRRVHITGNKVFSDAELKDVMRTKEGNWLSFLSDAGTYRKELFAQDRAILSQFYGQKGYIRVRVGDPEVTLSADRSALFLSFDIDEGEVYTIGSVNVSGELLEEAQYYRDLLTIETGGVADTIKVRQDVDKVAQDFGNEGYLYANVIPRTKIDPETRVVDFDFHVQKGQKVYIERIDILGNLSTRDKVIRRELMIDEGDLYHGENIRLSKFNLDRTGYFEQVRITTPRGSSDQQVVLKIEVVERSTGAFSIGAGFNSIESFQFIGQVQKRNLFGLGYDIALQARLGGRTQNFSLRYVDPYFLDSLIGFNFSAFSTERQFINFRQGSTGGSVGLTFPIRRRGRERINFGINYNISNERIEDIRQSIENIFDDGLTSSTTLSLSRDTRNRAFEASEGSFIRGSAEFADGEITGDNTFGKFILDSSIFFPVIPPTSWFIPGSVLQFHLNVGYITGFGDDIPLFERFFPGGILTLRGFELRSLGPEVQIATESGPTGQSTEDFPIGGNKQVIFNTEFVFPMVSAAGIKGVVFFDVGNAFGEGDPIDPTNLREAAGFGIRWFSPIGPLRFEWGFPLDKQDDENGVVFDFTIGSLF